jgi:hypothetical protein
MRRACSANSASRTSTWCRRWNSPPLPHVVTEGVFVIGAIAAVVGWLNQWFHFWG